MNLRFEKFMNWLKSNLQKRKNLLVLVGINVVIITLLLVVISSIIQNDSVKNQYFILRDFQQTNFHEMSIEELGTVCSVESANYLFLGDSITHRYDLESYFSNFPTVNSGVEGNTTSDILDNMQERVYQYNPTKIFLLIGINQLEFESKEDIFQGITDIIDQIKNKRGMATIYVESIYPVNSNFKGSPAYYKSNDKIKEINQLLKDYSNRSNVFYIDVFSSLVDDEGNLMEKYTIDGLHLSKEGYEVVTKVLEKYMKEC